MDQLIVCLDACVVQSWLGLIPRPGSDIILTTRVQNLCDRSWLAEKSPRNIVDLSHGVRLGGPRPASARSPILGSCRECTGHNVNQAFSNSSNIKFKLIPCDSIHSCIANSVFLLILLFNQLPYIEPPTL